MSLPSKKKLLFATLAFLSIFSASSLSAQSSKTESSVNKAKAYLEYAIQTANWLDTQKQTLSGSKDSIVWPASPSLSKDVSYNLYNGTSGIVLFYLQLHKATQDEQYLDRAKQGANGLLSFMDSATQESDPGYWTGHTGVAATLAEVFRVTKDQRYLIGYQRSLELLKESAKRMDSSGKGPIQFNEVTDIIAGSAGIGFFLLYADDIMKDQDAIGLAVRVGDGLLQSAKQVASTGNEKQLKWMMTPSFPREMPNYSHGTAGICDFLLALDQKLSNDETESDYDGRFRKAAIAGANYLAATANLDNESCLIDHHRTEDSQKEEPPLYYLGWCHGPSGTGRLFLNLYASDPKKKKWLTFAIQGGNSLLNSKIPTQRTPGFWNNVGVCCGNSGVGSYLIDLYELNQDSRLKELAIQLTQDTIERADQHGRGDEIGLSWSHAEHRARPEYLHTQTGLMQGAAGIGLWLLKLDQTLSGSRFDLEIPLHPFR